MMFYDNKNLIWYAGSWFIKSKGFLPLHRGMGEIDKGQYDKIKKIEYAPTCCLLAKKEIFEDIGFMDENYFVYCPKTVLCRPFTNSRVLPESVLSNLS